MTNEEINTAFGTENGQLGFSILRLRVPHQQSEFYRNVSTAQSAHSLGVTLIASPWSPPPEIKTNEDPVGGELEEVYYDDFAAHLDSFVDYMAENDAPIYAISVQNEPDINVSYESCDWSASQMVKFIKENAPSIGTRVMAPESYRFRREMSDPILNDTDACSNLDIVAGHIYGGGLESYPLAEGKGKEVWMTEHLFGQYDSGNVWSWALDVALEMNNVMNAGMSAYIWWYIVRYYGPISDGTNDSGEKGDVTKRGYVMSQFSRFIRPGYLRVECDDNPQRDVFASAYIDTSSSRVVIIAINSSSQAKNQTFIFQNGIVEIVRPYVTSETKNCNREDYILVTNDSLNVTLDAESVTTFVSYDLEAVEIDKPVSFKLCQNSPNPFNQVTTIRYELPRSSEVELVIYNLIGQEIKILEKIKKKVGFHEVDWKASNLPSGIYFYKLTAGSFTETKKLLLVK